jgi:sugar/nucleoside kinase (ribokinase family)
MGKFRGLFVGLTTIDIQHFVPSFPVANKKIKTIPPDILVGGPATNAAVAFACLNGGAFLTSATGKNPFTAFIEADFNTTGIRHFDLVGNQDFNPIIASVVTSTNNGDRNIFTHHPEEIKRIISPLDLLQQIQPHILLSDGFYPEFVLEGIKLAHQKNIPVVLDCGSWKPQYETLLNFADYVICSEDFLPPGSRNTKDIFEYLYSKNVQNIAITRGSNSILFSENETLYKIEIEKIL